MSIKVHNAKAVGVASQLRWLAGILEGEDTVQAFAIAWDGDSPTLRGSIKMDIGAWIRQIVESQEGAPSSPAAAPGEGN